MKIETYGKSNFAIWLFRKFTRKPKGWGTYDLILSPDLDSSVEEM